VSSHDLPDFTLIRRFLDGDEGAFRALYERHTPRLRMTLRRILAYEHRDLDDVVQETWLAACRGAHAFRGDAKFSSWLTTIGIRLVFDHLARASRPIVALTDDIAAADAPPTVIDLERAIAALTDRQRAVVVLHDIEGFTHDEIAEQLGVTSGTSKATLSRARDTLRRALGAGVSNAS
jgi:RNA polymerase sigma-70 factor (ECF subfamily)